MSMGLTDAEQEAWEAASAIRDQKDYEEMDAASGAAEAGKRKQARGRDKVAIDGTKALAIGNENATKIHHKIKKMIADWDGVSSSIHRGHRTEFNKQFVQSLAKQAANELYQCLTYFDAISSVVKAQDSKIAQDLEINAIAQIVSAGRAERSADAKMIGYRLEPIYDDPALPQSTVPGACAMSGEGIKVPVTMQNDTVLSLKIGEMLMAGRLKMEVPK